MNLERKVLIGVLLLVFGAIAGLIIWVIRRGPDTLPLIPITREVPLSPIYPKGTQPLSPIIPIITPIKPLPRPLTPLTKVYPIFGFDIDIDMFGNIVLSLETSAQIPKTLTKAILNVYSIEFNNEDMNRIVMSTVRTSPSITITSFSDHIITFDSPTLKQAIQKEAFGPSHWSGRKMVADIIG